MEYVRRRCLTFAVVFAFLFAWVGIAFATSMVIHFKDGTSAVYDTAGIESISFSESGSFQAAQVSGRIVFAEEFDKGLGDIWEKISVVGGNYDKFARMDYGKLIVNVPAGNYWGKTGIMSRYPFFTVDASMEASPIKIIFEFDSVDTTGYVIALSTVKDPDVWRQQNVWLHWRKHPTSGESTISFCNTQNRGDTSESMKGMTIAAPRTVTLSIRPGQVEVSMSDGTHTSGQFSWLKVGTPVYLYIFSHPADAGLPASFSLQSIKVAR